MPFLKVHIEGSQSIVKFEQGLSIREILESADIRIKSGCRGTGVCGLCKVRVVNGVMNPLTRNEEFFVSSPEVRLACQTLPLTDAAVEVLSPAPKSGWHILNSRYRSNIFNAIADPCISGADICYRVAVDLGTTNIMVSVIEMPSGRWIGGRMGINPQTAFGLDIISRLMAAAASDRIAYEQQKSVLTAIVDALTDISVREVLDLTKVTCCTIVGNTAMITLLAGCCCDTVLDPASWSRTTKLAVHTQKIMLAHTDLMHEADIDLVQPFAGFVGSDLLAGMFAAGITDSKRPALFMDFGTNTEIALWDGHTAWIASASGGPAFEANGISCGMPAEAGAISRVYLSAGGNSLFCCEVINNTEPKGICGSGLVDILACMLKTGMIDNKGRFTGESNERFNLGGDTQQIFLTSRDIDMIQRAKAGIAACIVSLCRRANMKMQSLERICIAGAFGRYLDIANAQAIGLLPVLDKNIFELWENAALIGCEKAALSCEQRHKLDDTRNKCKIINMADNENYEPVFFENLYLAPIEGMN
ncbi:MAG: ASKHA domain-containing protein [Nitrospiraceae bacterium]|nr:ASKHA domain-containing protein [Nitrospiraceae bacterium]